MCSYTTFAAKVDLCAHTYGKIGTFNRRVYSAYIFDPYTPSPYSAGSSWGLLSRKIFLIFIFQILARIHRMSGLRIFFLFSRFSHSISTRILFFYFFSDFRLDSCFDSVFQIILFNYLDSIKIRHLILDFIFRTPYRLNSHTSFRSIFTRLRFSYSLLIFDSFLLASISTCFSIADSTL